MTVNNGRRLRANHGKSTPTVEQLVQAKDYAALSKRGGIGRGALMGMARRGDRDAKATLERIGADSVEPDHGTW